MSYDIDPNGSTPEQTPEAIDDRTLGLLVRDVADDWSMPPRRLDQPTWRERVARGRGAGLSRGSRGWLPRLAGAATMAIVATVGLSLVAVWLTLPRGQVRTSTNPGAIATPRITDRPISSPLPALTVNGGLPSVTNVLLRTRGGYAFADLATGRLGATIPAGGDLHRLADGRLVCVCVEQDGSAAGFPTHEVINLRTYSPGGQPVGAKKLAEYSGVPDARATTESDRFPHLDSSVTYSPDGALAFAGWSARAYPKWHSGILTVDLASGRVLDRVSLPDASAGADTSIVSVGAPRVVASPTSDRVLMTRNGYAKVKGADVYSDQTVHFLASYTGGQLGHPAAFAPSASCPQGEGQSGFGIDGSVFVTCYSMDGLSLRRLSADGTILGDTPVGGGGAEGGTSTVARDGAAIWLWAPISRTVVRVDLRTGQSTSATAPAATATVDGGLTAAIGRWLAPAAVAKVYIDPGIALSPDGSRIYALGVNATEAGPFGGSSGVFAFDADSLAVLGSWAPTADFLSIAVSGDGKYVYAAGAPGVDASGAQSAFAASVTVYDASTGWVQLLAGNLDHDEAYFAAPVLP